MSQETLTPELRFEGFTDSWKKLEFPEAFEFPVTTNSLSRSQLNYDNGEIKSIHYGDILVQYNAILDVAKDKIPFITNGISRDYQSNLLANGDIVFADASEDEMVGKAVEVNVKTDEKIVSGLHTIVARPKIDMAEYFLGHYINSNMYHDQLLKLMQGTKVLSISKKSLKKTTVSYPDNSKEQQRVGLFLKQTDDIINLRQQELTKLQNFKQAMLQKLFPKEGESVPEIRSEGFDQEWKERAMSTITNSHNNLRVPITSSDRTQGNTPYYGASGVQDYVEGFTHNGSFVLLAEDGANDLSDYPVRFVEGEIWVNNHAHVLSGIKNEADNKYLSYALKTIDMAQYLVGGSRYKLNANTLKKIEVSIPSLNEQRLIGQYFYNLDKHIQAKQAELKKLKQFKKAMLSKLFV